ncbi:putative G-protein coupled receptor 83-like protein [Dinothrombium tinctorium]|uniref:Putative G-protein coupled receptor 83-like protein n=1 Tax=Dinothrombium tinctorium TaxID=1965070 RepID=A0A443R522_9ACAR|nr:putative G-protein coupled receptor 83-like protein [Dinothrombium tinctorium]
MAVSDLLAGLIIPAQWLFCSSFMLSSAGGVYPCAVCKATQKATYFLSTSTMVAIALHRYLAVFHPGAIHFNVKMSICITWILGLVVAITNTASAKVFEYFSPDHIITCRVILEFSKPFDSKIIRRYRVHLSWIAQFLIPLTITSALYAQIAFNVWRRSIVGEKSECRSRRLGKSKRKIILMLIVVLIVFILCWLPIHIQKLIDFIRQFYNKKKSDCHTNTTYAFIYWLSISSCCYNPIIYYIFNPKFRDGFRYLLNLRPQTSFRSIYRNTSSNTENVNEINTIAMHPATLPAL